MLLARRALERTFLLARDGRRARAGCCNERGAARSATVAPLRWKPWSPFLAGISPWTQGSFSVLLAVAPVPEFQEA